MLLLRSCHRSDKRGGCVDYVFCLCVLIRDFLFLIQSKKTRFGREGEFCHKQEAHLRSKVTELQILHVSQSTHTAFEDCFEIISRFVTAVWIRKLSLQPFGRFVHGNRVVLLSFETPHEYGLKKALRLIWSAHIWVQWLRWTLPLASSSGAGRPSWLQEQGGRAGSRSREAELAPGAGRPSWLQEQPAAPRFW